MRCFESALGILDYFKKNGIANLRFTNGFFNA